MSKSDKEWSLVQEVISTPVDVLKMLMGTYNPPSLEERQTRALEKIAKGK